MMVPARAKRAFSSAKASMIGEMGKTSTFVMKRRRFSALEMRRSLLAIPYLSSASVTSEMQKPAYTFLVAWAEETGKPFIMKMQMFVSRR